MRLSSKRIISLIFGLALLLIPLVFEPPGGLSIQGWRTAGIGLAMALLWASEAIPLPVTALLPLALFPLFNVSEIQATASPYANPIIFLFMGGFIIALSFERWGLHKRIALVLLSLTGSKLRSIIIGFMATTAFLSMWISNTATVLMILPIALSIIALIESDCKFCSKSFSNALLLSIAYSASIGGIGTLIGTPPNALLAGFLLENYAIRISFIEWMGFAVPLVLIGLPLTYYILTHFCFKISDEEIPQFNELIKRELGKLGRITGPEKLVACIAFITALSWISQPLISKYLPLMTDTSIAMLGALLLFIVPCNLKHGPFLIDWHHAKKLPWGVFILFGGGLSLAKNVESSGLARYIGTLAEGLSVLPYPLIVFISCAIVIVFTELNSNTATVSSFLPIAAAIAIGVGLSPVLLGVPIALVASCAFMLPVATPPNAIVFGSNRVTISQMIRTGIWLNLLFLGLIPLYCIMALRAMNLS